MAHVVCATFALMIMAVLMYALRNDVQTTSPVSFTSEEITTGVVIDGFDVRVMNDDDNPPGVLGCAKSEATVTIDVVVLDDQESGLLKLATIDATDIDLGYCIGPGGASVLIEPITDWNVTAQSGLVGGTGEILVENIAIYAEDESTAGILCQFDVVGSLEAQLDLEEEVIRFDGESYGLSAENVMGCVGFIQDESQVAISGELQIVRDEGE